MLGRTTSQVPPGAPFLSFKEALGVLRIGKSKLYDLLKKKKLKAKKHGRMTVILRDEIERYISEMPDKE